MKRLFVLFVALFAIGFSAKAQEQKKETLILTPKDSLFLRYMDDIARSVSNNTPRYKLYKTENIYNLIMLDTATGQVWQVQYGMNDAAEAMAVPIDKEPLIQETQSRNGRFELYPTKNTYTFILLDTKYGFPYQVQWNTDPQKRFRTRIYDW